MRQIQALARSGYGARHYNRGLEGAPGGGPAAAATLEMRRLHHHTPLAELQSFFDSSPAMRLLRSPHAAWIIDFLQQQFKAAAQITLPHGVLQAALANYLMQPAAGLGERPPADYLAAWCASDCGWLKRFVDDSAPEPLYQLTPATELVLAFVRQAMDHTPAVGTQTHLRSILGLLEHVAHAAQSAGAAADGTRGRLTPQQATNLREQFALAMNQLEQLKSQCRGVEERFRELTRDVQQRLLADDQPRGDILEFALDAEEYLKSAEQGQSFFEFLKLVHDPASQQRIAAVVQQLTHLQLVADQHDELSALRSMLPSLLAEAEKILRTAQHLSHTLRRLLDARSTRHHRQLAEVLRDIRGLARRLAAAPPHELSLEVEVEVDLQLPLDRPLWAPVEPFEEVVLEVLASHPEARAAALQQLTGLERIDWPAMRRNIAQVVHRRGPTSLAELLEQCPVRSGIIEVIGYLQIAYEDGHLIDPQQTLDLPMLWEPGRARVLQLPQVTFCPPSAARSNRTAAHPAPGDALETTPASQGESL